LPTQTDSDTGASSSFAIATPRVDLPKGGGAIRGIGEKFAANPVSGTGSMSVPIATSPGRLGFGPQLSLSYDSGAGNGPFGFGWSLSLPSITRKTDKGLPQYFDVEDSDVFILSGAEDLVPVYRQDADATWVAGHPGYRRHPGDFWLRDRTGRLAIHEDEVDGYRVRRYRPRIEGLFARIERWSKIGAPGDVHWRSISKDNILTIYGLDTGSRIADPLNASRIFTWLICETRDDKGNAVLYRYKAEDAAGVATDDAHERNRGPQNDVRRTANRYLKRIHYGNRTPLLDDAGRRPRLLTEAQVVNADWMFEAVFDYGEHDAAAPTPNDAGAWAYRPDPFSSYRSGFEVRTTRLCQRFLMFHHFPGEAGVERDCLVRSTGFTYSDEVDPTDVRNPVYTFLEAVAQTGYRRSDGGYHKRSLPPVEFEYTQPVVQSSVEEADPESLENLPIGLDGSAYRWTDLHGEGIPGILTEQAGAWFYKRNLSPIPEILPDGRQRVKAKFSPLETVALKPTVSLTGGAEFMDLAGDGQPDVVVMDGPMPGLYEHDDAEGWEPFRPFPSRLNRSLRDPNLRFLDLDGDGHADVFITEDDAFVWHASLAEKGFGPARRVAQALDEENGPRIVFADGTESIYLADLSGDGLTDIVRIRNGEVCYWPNLGYCRFGAKITMDNAPWFDHPDQFDQSRIRLADIDGSGTTDIIYLHRDGVRLYFNQSGNSWGLPHLLQIFPRVDDVVSILTADLLGNGTACLVWSSPLPGDARRQMRYVNLMGGQKPHLLIKTINNLGAETRVDYAPSTKFYLQDKRDGKPWITRLPFPVHVVERVETYDYISRNRFVTRYAYHHGYFDGEEREFRGFGMVEQWDTEQIAALAGGAPPADNIDAQSQVPPVHTKSWFHTGVYLGRDHVSDYFAGLLDASDRGKYFREPGLNNIEARALLLPDTVLPTGLSLEEEREACRALKGSMLRQEVYANDAGPGATPEQNVRARTPYTVIEQNFSIRALQPRGTNRHAVFFTHAREEISFHYERNPADPRIQHALTLEVDPFGNVLKAAAIGYGRRATIRFRNAQGQVQQVPNPGFAGLTASDQARQTTALLTYTENRATNSLESADTRRNPLPCEAITFELTGYAPTGPAARFRAADLVEPDPAAFGRLRHKFADQVAYEAAATGNPCRRPIEWVRTLYRRDDLTGPLPLGVLESLALPFESYKLAFTPGLVTQVYEGRVTDAMLANDGGYVHSQGEAGSWIPSGQIFYSPDKTDDAAAEAAHARRHFFLPHRFRDPFENENVIRYDRYKLLMVSSRDPAGNEVAAKNDYRVLQPSLVTDPNGNRAGIAFDTLGMVAGTAMMGKEAENLGDSLTGFRADLTRQELDQFLGDPKGAIAADLLGNATNRIVYDIDRFLLHRDASKPVFAATITRETHISDLQPGEASTLQSGFSYSDGFEREIQKKIQAEPGPLDGQGPIVNPRWVGSGWTIFNNKGNPVKQYEPFFDDTHDFRFAKQVGFSSTLFYDPVERVVATLHPDHSWEKVVFDPWRQETWDVNDTVSIADPAADEHVGSLFRRLPDADYLPTWQNQRSDGALGPDEQNAAIKAAAHAGTPTIAHFDTLGRTVLTIADNGLTGKVATRVELDIEGNQRAVIDAKDRVVVRYDYDMLGNRIHQASMEAGARWMLNDIEGKAVRAWDSRNHQSRTAYDALRRPTDSFLREGAGIELLVGRTVYGENRPNAEQNNLRGKVVELFDQACVVTSDEYDFKGNLLRNHRQLAKAYKTTLDWSTIVPLETDTYTSRTRYDALNRPVTRTEPDNSVIRHGYNEANLLERVDANLRGEQQNGQPVWTPFVTNIDYDAKGQRRLIDYGNGVRTTYDYDPLTFRLMHLLTRRNAVTFPDDCPQPPPVGWPGCQLQNLHYTYDPVGNITHIRDDAQQTVYFRNKCVEPSADYCYDALYRLIEATGREHLGQVGAPASPNSYNDEPRVGILWAANDGNAMGRYLQRYKYDEAGNFQEMIHRGSDPANPGWTRRYVYNEPSQLEAGNMSNRLTSTTVGGTTETYSTGGNGYDAHGNMLRMPQLQIMQWNFKDQLQMTQRQAVNTDDEDGVQRQGERTWYVYDAAGQRVRKVTELATGEVKDERIYLGGFESYRRHGANPLVLETLHIMDDKQRIALVETRTEGNEPGVPAQLIRYQFGNHLGSVSLELDRRAQIITYEEYTPYGSTSYQAVRSQTETPKRYRHTGKERDEESGLSYHGARYYAPWLGRWTSCDPAGLVDGLNQYAYVRNNPIGASDPTGKWSVGWIIAVVAVVVVVAVVSVATLGAGAAPAGAAGAAILGASAEAAVATTAVVATGAEVAVATTAVATTEAVIGTTAALATTEAAAGTTAVLATTEAVAGTTAVVATTEAAVGTTAASGLTAAQASGLGTAATAITGVAATPQGQQVLEELESVAPTLENEAQVAAQEVQSVLPGLQSAAPQTQGVATVFSHAGSHVSILVEHGEEALHTEQVVMEGRLTTIAEVQDAAEVLQSVKIPLPDASAAMEYQEGVIETATGLYNRSSNSCVTHVGDVLREGGVEGVPERTIDIIRWLKDQ
jgi:RHS repeat-associated protein